MQNPYLKKIFILLKVSLFLFFYKCSSPSSKTEDVKPVDVVPTHELSHFNFQDTGRYSLQEYKMIPGETINIDSLYTQVAYELSPTRWILVGQSENDDPSGIKLMLVDPTKDFQLIYRSKGAYESFILHPTFFKSTNPKDPIVLLCALGQTESWGQDLFLMNGDSIREIAYLDVAVKKEIEMEDDDYSLIDIASFTTIKKDQDGLVFHFNADSIKYYGFRNNTFDPVIAGASLKYQFKDGKLTEIWLE